MRPYQFEREVPVEGRAWFYQSSRRLGITHRIKLYELPQPEDLRIADAENLPFTSGSFDPGYSWGVLHHSPDTLRAVAELVRLVQPGSEIKIMLFNRRCLAVFKLWVKHALLRGRPWKNFRWAMRNHLEIIGTKGYPRDEVRAGWSRGA